jgi:hypothetical protein
MACWPSLVDRLGYRSLSQGWLIDPHRHAGPNRARCRGCVIKPREHLVLDLLFDLFIHHHDPVQTFVQVRIIFHDQNRKT